MDVESFPDPHVASIATQTCLPCCVLLNVLWCKAVLPGLSGPIRQLRLKSDTQHSTRIAFVEFEEAADAQRALRECSGALLGAEEPGLCCRTLRVSQHVLSCIKAIGAGIFPEHYSCRPECGHFASCLPDLMYDSCRHASSEDISVKDAGAARHEEAMTAQLSLTAGRQPTQLAPSSVRHGDAQTCVGEARSKHVCQGFRSSQHILAR